MARPRSSSTPTAAPRLPGALDHRGRGRLPVRIGERAAAADLDDDDACAPGSSARRRHGYGRGGTGGVVPSTQTGIPWEVMLTVELVRPAEVASMTDVPA